MLKNVILLQWLLEHILPCVRFRHGTLLLTVVATLLCAEAFSEHPRSAIAQTIDPGGGQVNLFLPFVSGGTAPVATPTSVAATETPTAQARFSLVNLQIGADASYAATGQITPRDRCLITGRNLQSSYWFLACDSGASGWIDGRFIVISGSTQSVPLMQTIVVVATATPVVPTSTPLPAPTSTSPPPPTPNLMLGWRSTFYNNRTLSGEPVLVDDLPDANFTWGSGSPAPAVTVDNFSARFERRFALPRGYHRFELRADDGVRFWLNNQLLIDGWGSTGDTIYSTGVQLASGVYDFRIEYFEATGNAYLQFIYEYLGVEADWQVDYYSNTSLSGAPLLSQPEASRRIPLEFNIGRSAPFFQPANESSWSARWQGNFFFWAGDYTFRTQASGGVRVYIDELLVLDGWSDSQKDINNVFRRVGEGEHTIRVEYYHQTGDSSLRVWWYLMPGQQQPF